MFSVLGRTFNGQQMSQKEKSPACSTCLAMDLSRRWLSPARPCLPTSWWSRAVPEPKAWRSGSRVTPGGRLRGEGDRPPASEPSSAPLKNLREEFCVGLVVFKDDISWGMQKQRGLLSLNWERACGELGCRSPFSHLLSQRGFARWGFTKRSWKGEKGGVVSPL